MVMVIMISTNVNPEFFRIQELLLGCICYLFYIHIELSARDKLEITKDNSCLVKGYRRPLVMEKT